MWWTALVQLPITSARIYVVSIRVAMVTGVVSFARSGCTRRWHNAGLMLAQRPGRWPTLVQHWFNVPCLLFDQFCSFCWLPIYQSTTGVMILWPVTPITVKTFYNVIETGRISSPGEERVVSTTLQSDSYDLLITSGLMIRMCSTCNLLFFFRSTNVHSALLRILVQTNFRACMAHLKFKIFSWQTEDIESSLFPLFYIYDPANKVFK